MKKLYVFYFLTFCMFSLTKGQTVEWINYGGGGLDDRIADITSDASESVYVTGLLESEGNFSGTAVVGGIFTAKYDNSGVLQWINAPAAVNSSGNGICMDALRNIYVVGWMEGSMQVGDTFLTGLGSHDILLMKFSPEGSLIWSRQFGGAYSDKSSKIIFGENGLLYFTGYYSSSVTIGGFFLENENNLSDIFLACSDTAGNIQWVSHAGGPGEDRAYALAMDGNQQVYVTGTFEQHAYFGSNLIQSEGKEDVFVAKYNNTGTMQWVAQAGSDKQDHGLGLCVSPGGNCYITGNYAATMHFGTLSLINYQDDIDIYVACYSAAGTCTWAVKGSSYDVDRASVIKRTKEGKLLVGGGFESTLNLGSISCTSAGSSDIFIARYDSLGNLETLQRAGGDEEDHCFAAVPLNDNRVALAGYFSDDVTFGNYSLFSNGGTDGVVMNLSLNEIEITSLSDSLLCAGESFDVHFNSQGVYGPGNIFGVYLSSSSGSFSSPTLVGSLSSIVPSGIVHCTLPSTIFAGNNYRFRISSSDLPCFSIYEKLVPIEAIPVVSWGTFPISYCESDPPVPLTGGTPAGGVYTGAGVIDGLFYPGNAGLGTHSISYSYTNISGCQKSIVKNLTVTQLPLISFTMDSVVCIETPPFTLTGGTPSGGNYKIDGSVSGSIFNPAALGAGIHQVVYQVINGPCAAKDTVNVLVTICSGVEETAGGIPLMIYPNPSFGMLQVATDVQGKQYLVKIFDALGHLRKEFDLAGTSKMFQLDLRQLPAGAYTLQLSNHSGVWTKWFVLE